MKGFLQEELDSIYERIGGGEPITDELNTGTITLSPPHMVDFIIGAIVNTGFGLTVILYSNATPSQLLDFGMIEYLMT